MSIILFIVILLVLIIVHEYGHFIVAKKSGIRVDEFGIGFPPRALTYMRKDGTDYTLNWLPFGGFVKIFGETPNEESISGPDSDRSFVNKPKYIQAAVLAAGVFFNMLLAWVLLSVIFMIGTDIAVGEDDLDRVQNVQLVVANVLPESPAADVGLEPGDIIAALSVVGGELKDFTPEAASEFIAEHAESQLLVEVERGDEIIDVAVSPEAGLVPDEPERKVLGITMGQVGFLQISNPILALYEGALFTYDLTFLVGQGLFSFFAGLFTFSADFGDVAGPIGIVSVVGDAAAIGLTSLLFLTAIISINLAIINILPIPALDGGRLLFLLIESVKGSPIKPEVANTIHALFFFGLIALILVISYFDIARLIG